MSTPPRFSVLVLEDEPSIRRLMVLVLKQHDVATAATVAEAWAHIEGGLRPDCILCDVDLKAAGTGTVLYERLRDAHPELLRGFVWMSGGTMHSEADLVVSASGLPHLVKPLANADLREAVVRHSQR